MFILHPCLLLLQGLFIVGCCFFFSFQSGPLHSFPPFFAKEFLEVVEFYFLFQENKLFLQFGLWLFT